MDKHFYSPGKLLLSGEYLVLDGAKALAVPTKFGQHLTISKTNLSHFSWISRTNTDKIWFEAEFKIENNSIQLKNLVTGEKSIADRLLKILQEIEKLQPDFLQNGIKLETKLEFPQHWGLGSSSTLIANLAEWAKIDPYKLLKQTFGGSGYDIACAQHKTPLLFELKDEKPLVKEVNFSPEFSSELFFVHLNKKQNSRDSIQHYRKQSLTDKKEYVKKVSLLTEEILASKTLSEFENLLKTHEQLLSKILNTPTIQEQLFTDYNRQLKSLGGWGGDFILATGGKKEQTYFQEKGFSTILSWEEMVL
ncbi:GYDIA family GHMP kinase [Mesonia maritima]|uniref:Mevalonate kinase n=1 Tax=Mesonia maritima TaxID=1793873 RepID=A0ABU1K1M1_9FLAO|nr:GYDIA family GHMP kinase [Mesonia maritima]MDR6299491.1 mevalonate kinase [Mesonia maritima]